MTVDATYRLFQRIKALSRIHDAAEKSNMLGALLDAGVEGRLNVDTKKTQWLLVVFLDDGLTVGNAGTKEDRESQLVDRIT